MIYKCIHFFFSYCISDMNVVVHDENLYLKVFLSTSDAILMGYNTVFKTYDIIVHISFTFGCFNVNSVERS